MNIDKFRFVRSLSRTIILPCFHYDKMYHSLDSLKVLDWNSGFNKIMNESNKR